MRENTFQNCYIKIARGVVVVIRNNNMGERGDITS